MIRETIMMLITTNNGRVNEIHLICKSNYFNVWY